MDIENIVVMMTLESMQYRLLSDRIASRIRFIDQICDSDYIDWKKVKAVKAEIMTSSDVSLQSNPPVSTQLEEYVPPKLPPIPAISKIIGQCSDPYEKQLTHSDTNKLQCRLCLHKKFVDEFVRPLLTPEEMGKKSLEVDVYDSEGKMYNMTLKLWSDKMPVLTSGWTTLLNFNGFEEGKDFITIWMFRHARTGKPCFAITSRRVPDARTKFKKRKKVSSTGEQKKSKKKKKVSAN